MSDLRTEISELWRAGRSAHAIHGSINAIRPLADHVPIDTVIEHVTNLEQDGAEVIALLSAARAQVDRPASVHHAIDAAIAFINAHTAVKEFTTTSTPADVDPSAKPAKK